MAIPDFSNAGAKASPKPLKAIASRLHALGMTEVSAAMEWTARFVAVLLLRHLATAEFSQDRDRLFAIVEPINTYAVVGVSVFCDLEQIGRSAV